MNAKQIPTQLINKKSGTVLIEQLFVAETFFPRLKGLIGRKTLDKGTGLKIIPCNSVHTFFMRFAIDVIFINANDKVIASMENVKPARMSKIYRNAAYVIEANAFELAPFVKIGDTVIKKQKS